jgi:hypothetical protein
MPSLTYAELAEALRITPTSANKLARRRRWPRLMGNDGRARVAVPDEALVRQDVPPVSPMDSPPDNPVHVLQAQVARLEGELAGVREALTEARARAAAAEARAEAAETRIENLLAELADRGAQHADERAVLVAQVASERRNAEKAIAALAALAERLDALAAERARPWWRRLVG